MANLINRPRRSNELWAIQLLDSEHNKWNKKENFTELTITWDEADILPVSSLDDILIEISKSHSEKNNASIKNLAHGINNFINNIKYGDQVIGVEGENRIQKFGLISRVDLSMIPNKKINVNFHWEKNYNELYTKKSLFNESYEIQLINIRTLVNNLPKDQKVNIESLLMLTNKQHSLKNENERYVASEKPEHVLELEYDERVVDLFFVTNRKPNSASNEEKYGYDRDTLKLGFCRVRIPEIHEEGILEKPKLIKLEFSENPRKHITIVNVEELDEKNFISKFETKLKLVPLNEAMIYIHGFNKTFDESAKRAAQIAWDIPFNGISGFFSWPSSGKLFDYEYDEDSCEWSINDLEKFIETLLLNSNIDKLHLLAQSMGNRLLCMSLNNLSNKDVLSEKLNIIHQIVLAAPDIDQEIFLKNILPKFKSIGARRTLYSSDKDVALHLSESIRKGKVRLGEAGKNIFVSEGLDTIDASNIESDFVGHSYIFNTKELLSDLFYLFKNNFDPSERRLRVRNQNDSLKYWVFAK